MRKVMHWRQLVGVVIVVTAIGCTKEKPGTSSDDDAAGGAVPDNGASTEATALVAACDALVTATPDTIAERWYAVRRAFRMVVAERSNGPARDIRDWSSWFELHEIEGVIAACGIHGDAERAHLAVLMKSPPLVSVLQGERRALCAFGSRLAEAGASVPWTEDVRVTWNAACVRFFSGDVLPEPQQSPGVARAPQQPSGSCPGVEALADQRPAMIDRSLEREAWIAFGKTLASCGPSTEPWSALKLSGGRAQYMDDYVVPYINGDALRGAWFQGEDSVKYEQIVSEWLDGG